MRFKATRWPMKLKMLLMALLMISFLGNQFVRLNYITVCVVRSQLEAGSLGSVGIPTRIVMV